MRGIVILIIPLLFGCAVRDEARRVRGQLNYIEEGTRRTEGRVAQIDSLSREEIELIIRFRAEQIEAISRIENEIESMRTALNELLGISITQRADTSIPSEIFSIAHTDFLRGNYDLAIAGFLSYINSIPNLDEVRYFLGESYLEIGKYEKAKRAFSIVVEDYPESKRASASLYKIAKLWEAKGDTLSRDRYLERLLKNHPDSPEAELLRETE